LWDVLFVLGHQRHDALHLVTLDLHTGGRVTCEHLKHTNTR
jgi:hypothetical protein